MIHLTDKKALKLLSQTHRRELTGEEINYCIEKNVLSKHKPVSHSELIHQIKSAAAAITAEKAVKGFLYSISSGDHRYRTALSSLIWANSLYEHPLEPLREYNGIITCKICGERFHNGISFIDMVKYCRDRLIPSKNFMDTGCGGYVLNDLTEFAKLPEVDHCDKDIYIINRMLGLAEEISPTNKVNALLKLIAAEESISLSAADAYSVLGVLSACGAFDTPEYKSCMSGFVPCCERSFVYETDIYYPLNMWRGKYGINYSAFQNAFGNDIASMISPIKGKVRRTEKSPSRSASAAEEFFRDGEHIIELSNDMRYYYGLFPLDKNWDRQTSFSVTHGIMKRTEMFFDGNTVKKFIYEELAGKDGYKYYLECDTDTATNDRKLIIPKTSRGREQPLTPSLLQTPTYMNGHLQVILNSKNSSVTSFNSRNDQLLPIPASLPDRQMKTSDDFYEYTEKLISSLPENYPELIEGFRNKKRTHIRFTAGDIFRIQFTPHLYTYCLILGKVRDILKWKEIPEEHPFHKVMTQPIIYRQYGIITDDPHMTAAMLSTVPLLDPRIAQDNEIIFGTYPIVCSKKLEESDIDLGFGINRNMKTVVWGLTMHTFGNEYADMFDDAFSSDMGICIDRNGGVSMTYGVSLGINYIASEKTGHIDSQKKTAQDKLRSRIAARLGLDENNGADEFAERFGGITRKQYIELAEKRFKR